MKKDDAQDQSMEEILQSIKRIIAEENDEPAKPAGEATENGGVKGSDVLELTDMVDDKQNFAPAPAKKKEPAPEVKKTEKKVSEKQEAPADLSMDAVFSDDTIMAMEAAAKAAEAAEARAAAEPEPMPEPEPEPEPVSPPAPAPSAARPKGQDVLEDIDSLLSEETVKTSAAALRTLSKRAPEAPALPPVDSPQFRSGATVEDLVIESLRPMLKDWLDSNLPGIVERLVEREIKKLTD